MKSATEIAALVSAGQISAEEVMSETFKRIDAHNSDLNAFTCLRPHEALNAAREIDKRRARREKLGPLAGVPFGVKDNEDCIGFPTTQGSLFYRDSVPVTRDSISVARLRAADAIPVGKTAAAEFGLDGVTSTRAWGVTRNPWNLELTPGGSSGGSASAVAAGLVPLCTASDGGGSTRVPAAFTGLVGFKPTHGRIPRASGASDINSPGALTMTVADTARYIDLVSGPDDRDRMSLPKLSESLEERLERCDVNGLRAIWSPDLGFAPVEREIEDLTRAAAMRTIDAAGIKLVEPGVELTNVYLDWACLAAHRLRMRLEYDGFLPARLHELSPGPLSLIRRFGHASDNALAQAASRLIRLEQEVAAVFHRCDFLLTPCAACTPYAAEGPTPETIAGKDARQTGGEPFTIFANTCWNPSVSIPAGITRNGLPAGLLITGRRHEDERVLRFARIGELALGWPRIAPPYGLPTK